MLADSILYVLLVCTAEQSAWPVARAGVQGRHATPGRRNRAGGPGSWGGGQGAGGPGRWFWEGLAWPVPLLPHEHQGSQSVSNLGRHRPAKLGPRKGKGPGLEAGPLSARSLDPALIRDY